MTYKVILDTNIFVLPVLSKFIELSSEELRAAQALSQTSESSIVLTDFIFKESSLLLQKVIARRYKLNQDRKIHTSFRHRVEAYLEKSMKSSLFIEYDLSEIKQGFSIFQKANKKDPLQTSLTLADASLIPIAKRYDLEIFTLDEQLQKLCTKKKAKLKRY